MNILFLTNPSYGCYGYSVVVKNVAKGLREAGHNVMVIGTVTAGNLIKDEHGTPNIPAYYDAYAKDALRYYIKGLDIDCVVTILDCWTPDSYDIPDIVHDFKIPIIAHVTARSTPQSPWWSTYLVKCDHVVAPSWFGLGTVREIEDFKEKSSYIQHGVDLSVYKPDKKARDDMRKMLGYEDKFVFLAVGRNKGIQKRYDILFKAYKTLLTNFPEAKGKTVLHVHANPHESNAIDLEQMRNMGYHDIGVNHIKFSKMKFDGKKLVLCKNDDPNAMLLNPNWGLDEIEMAKLYNMADCHIQSGEGESFCLPQMESQACGIPQIFPDHSVGPEMIGAPKSGLLVRIATEETTPILTDVALADPLDMGKCMMRMYVDKAFRKECSRNALENAKNYGWEDVVKKWLFILEKVTEPKLNFQTGEMGF